MGFLPEHRLPKGDTALSELSLGCAPLGNLYHEVSDDDARATVDAAWQLGVRYFDTAPHYGLGLSERRLGAALASRPRDAYVLSSKVGRLLEPAEVVERLDDAGFAVPASHRRVWDFSRDGVRRSLEPSLERLGLDHVDIVYVHDPDDHVAGVLDAASRRWSSCETGRGRRSRSRHERRGGARTDRARGRHRRRDAGRPLDAARAGQPRRPACRRVPSAASRSSPRVSSTAASSPGRSLPCRRSTTTSTRRLSLSSGRARSRAFASGTGQHCPRQQSPSRSRTPRWSAFASARGVRSRSS